ncbi:MAG: DUF3592 domain-containing protein [bacterium]
MKKVSIGIMFFGLVFVIIGVYFVVHQKLTQWETATGSISQSTIKKHLTAHAGNVSNLAPRWTYTVEIGYRYNVDEKDYFNTRFSLGTGKTVKDGFSNEQQAKNWLDQSEYKRGQSITVYYNPTDPKDSLIQTSTSIETLIPIFMGLFFIAAGLFFLAILNLPKKSDQTGDTQ